jgi:6-phosphogluconolactonase (cycloisomerase 2 family)
VARRTLLGGLLAVLSIAPLVAHGPDRDDDWHDEGAGAVFTLTNAAAGNSVLAYRRSADGSLAAAGAYRTGGNGTGAGLGSQDAIIVTGDRRFVLAVNAGSNSISSFRIRHDGLQLVHTVPSGGVMPTSLAARNGLVLVLNAGVPNNISGFRLGPHGRLHPIPGFSGPLSASSTSPAQVAFSDDGDTVIVTERATNLITTYAIDDDRLVGPYFTPSSGPTPFGFAVTARNTVLVSEAGAGGGASSYRVRRDRLEVVSSNIMTGQRAACWAIVTPNGRFGYVTNAGTGNISGFEIARDGSARLLDEDGVTAVTGGNPTDMAMSADGRYLYARVANNNAIAIFQVGRTGRLAPLPAVSGTPAGLAGLAGF